MRLRDLPGYLRDTVLRTLPHAAPTGLIAIGKPGRGSPVLLTGNFTLTVRRVRQVLRGRDAWLLCASSKGINVWCAAGGGHLTHHDVISVIRTSEVEEKVDHREVVLPQLCATGVDRHKVTEATGWETRWGPARLEDLPGFLDHRQRVRKGERFMRFPLWERLEMASMWSVPMVLLGGGLVWWAGGWRTLVATALVVFAMVGGLFALLPWLRIGGRSRWLLFALFAAAGFGLGAGLLAVLATLTKAHLVTLGVTTLLAMGILSVDLAGTTPWYGSYINTWHNEAHVDLVEEKCTGVADCVQVCPRDVLQMNGRRRKVEIARDDQCIQCGACVVQCPEDALRFRYDDGSIVEAATIKRTRMNMVGRRTVEVHE